MRRHDEAEIILAEATGGGRYLSAVECGGGDWFGLRRAVLVASRGGGVQRMHQGGCARETVEATKGGRYLNDAV